MKTQVFGPLYAKASTGKIKTWQATVVAEEDKPVMLNTLHGYLNGKITSNSKVIKGKNNGKTNETTPWEQACSDAQSKVNKKMDEGYVINQADLENQTLLLPMLAHSYTKRKHNIEWPAYVQPKLNGVRCLSRMTENEPEYISRNGKQYNTLDHLNNVVEKLTCELGHPLDGEIFNPNWAFQEIIRAIKKDRGETTDKLQYWVYDVVDVNSAFEDRYDQLEKLFETIPEAHKNIGNTVLVPTVLANSEEEMMELHKKWTLEGYEGTIVRNKKGKYILKNRSKDLQKYKDFIDEEYVIVGGKEASGNDAGTVIFECRTKDGKIFSVRPKGSREQRREWFNSIDKIVNKKLTVRYQELSEEGVPIFPIGIILRDYE